MGALNFLDDDDDELFKHVINNKKHVLHRCQLLPRTIICDIGNSLELPRKTHHLMDSNFIQCMLLDSY